MTKETQRDSLRNVLRAHGLRYSKPREAILSFFREQDRHISAEGLYVELKQRGQDLSLSTVYLNLGVLKTSGLIREFEGVGGEALYDSSVDPHHHVICTSCGAIADLPLIRIDDTPPTRYLQHRAEHASGWQIEEPTLSLQGLCPSCQRAS